VDVQNFVNVGHGIVLKQAQCEVEVTKITLGARPSNKKTDLDSRFHSVPKTLPRHFLTFRHYTRHIFTAMAVFMRAYGTSATAICFNFV
jgi:hypothetical protein